MKKRISALVFALAIIFSISASAATRTNNPILVTPTVVATSSDVTCTLDVSSDSGSVTVSGTVTLYKDGSRIASWSVTSPNFEKTYIPGGKGTYRMDYSITVKGSAGTDRLSGSEKDTY